MNAALRCFLALAPDEVARSSLAALPRAPGGRPVLPQDLHLTLAFLGDLRAASPEALLDGLAAALEGHGPTGVELDRVEVWPYPRACCAVGESPQVAALAADLWRGLAGLGYRAGSRAFRTHVTLVRAVPGARASMPVLRLPQPVRWVSREVLLMASQTGPPPPGNPRYRVLGVRPLA